MLKQTDIMDHEMECWLARVGYEPMMPCRTWLIRPMNVARYENVMSPWKTGVAPKNQPSPCNTQTEKEKSWVRLNTTSNETLASQLAAKFTPTRNEAPTYDTLVKITDVAYSAF